MTEVHEADRLLAQQIVSGVRGYGVMIRAQHFAAVAIAEYRHGLSAAMQNDQAIERAARALYDHWRDEQELHGIEYAPWENLGDKQTWRDRARAALTAGMGEQFAENENYSEGADHG